jgi:peptidoglycan/xylan/chitin deacetylase (PgdA/CDA1 family)
MHLHSAALVLLYHRVTDVALDSWLLSVSVENFAAQMRTLRHEAKVVRLHDVIDAATAPSAVPRIAITFDDGYADNLYNALPVLQKHALPATFFACVGPIADQAEYWWDTLERILLWPSTLPQQLDITIQGGVWHFDLADSATYSEATFQKYVAWRAWEPPPTPRHALYVAAWEQLRQLDSESRTRVLNELRNWANLAPDDSPSHRALRPSELRRLSASALADIGAHTVTHPSLATLSVARQKEEIEGSRRWLEQLVPCEVSSFSYPFGKPADYTSETVELVRNSGCVLACSNIPAPVTRMSDPLQLPRMHVCNWTGEEFANQVRHWLGPAGISSSES